MSRKIGTDFEQRACGLMVQAGYEIVATNYTVAKVGEIDIVAFKDDTLAVVEVKARKHARYGTAVEMVTPAKQRKIINTLAHFLQDEHHQCYANANIRFDVIGFDDQTPLWLQGAFLTVE